MYRITWPIRWKLVKTFDDFALKYDLKKLFTPLSPSYIIIFAFADISDLNIMLWFIILLLSCQYTHCFLHPSSILKTPISTSFEANIKISASFTHANT